MRGITLIALASTLACSAAAPGSTALAPSAARCRDKGCTWSVDKATRLERCKKSVTDDVIRGAECMGPYVQYFGTKPCKNTRAWLARLRAGIPEVE